MCSDRLDTDFPDIDLSQLDTSDFDSVNCLSELPWCHDQPADESPASIHYSTGDELFEVSRTASRRVAARCELPGTAAELGQLQGLWNVLTFDGAHSSSLWVLSVPVRSVFTCDPPGCSDPS